MDNSNEARNCIIILGMHRSGTSALARIINLLGVDLGNNFLPPAPDNPKGFWEHLDILRVHERLLRELGSMWDDIRPLPQDWWLGEAAETARAEIRHILKRDFRESTLWGLKEPRICRLLRLWQPVLQELGYRPHFIIIFRDPVEVSASLQRRNETPRAKSLWWWLDHVLESERETRIYPRTFVSFNQLIADWRAAVERIAHELNIQWPCDYEEAKHSVTDFLDSRLRHENISESAIKLRSDVPEVVLTVYEALKRAENRDQGDAEAFSIAAESVQSEMLGFCSTAFREDAAERERALLKAWDWIGEQQQVIKYRESELRTLKNSRSWRWTEPLRRVWWFFGSAGSAKERQMNVANLL